MRPTRNKKKGIEITRWKVEDDDEFQSLVIDRDPDIEVSFDHYDSETSEREEPSKEFDR